jgi:hypothetical protein
MVRVHSTARNSSQLSTANPQLASLPLNLTSLDHHDKPVDEETDETPKQKNFINITTNRKKVFPRYM